ncbi:MAG: YggT family protein [Patescibacteria group bacterium]
MLQSYIVQSISIFIQLLIFAIFVRVILSWLKVPPRGFLFNIIVEATEPILGLFRRLIPPIGGVLDISPILAFFALDILRSILIGFLT